MTLIYRLEEVLIEVVSNFKPMLVWPTGRVTGHRELESALRVPFADNTLTIGVYGFATEDLRQGRPSYVANADTKSAKNRPSIR